MSDSLAVQHDTTIQFKFQPRPIHVTFHRFDLMFQYKCTDRYFLADQIEDCEEWVSNFPPCVWRQEGRLFIPSQVSVLAPAVCPKTDLASEYYLFISESNNFQNEYRARRNAASTHRIKKYPYFHFQFQCKFTSYPHHMQSTSVSPFPNAPVLNIMLAAHPCTISFTNILIRSCIFVHSGPVSHCSGEKGFSDLRGPGFPVSATGL